MVNIKYSTDGYDVMMNYYKRLMFRGVEWCNFKCVIIIYPACSVAICIFLEYHEIKTAEVYGSFTQ